MEFTCIMYEGNCFKTKSDKADNVFKQIYPVNCLSNLAFIIFNSSGSDSFDSNIMPLVRRTSRHKNFVPSTFNKDKKELQD